MRADTAAGATSARQFIVRRQSSEPRDYSGFTPPCYRIARRRRSMFLLLNRENALEPRNEHVGFVRTRFSRGCRARADKPDRICPQFQPSWNSIAPDECTLSFRFNTSPNFIMFAHALPLFSIMIIIFPKYLCQISNFQWSK